VAGNQFIFANSDIDGSLSYLFLRWITNAQIPYKTSSLFTIEQDFNDWYRKNGENYDRVYLLGIDVTNCLNFVNKDNVIIFKHQSPINKLTTAKIITDEKSNSTSMLLYNKFKKKVSLCDSQKLALLLVNDIKKYTFELPQSRDLDILYKAYTGDKLLKFTTDFNGGFTGFLDKHRALINLYKKGIHNAIKELKIYKGVLPFKGEQYNVISTFADKYVNEISDKLLDHFESDICFVVNVDKNRVSFRRSPKCEVDLNVLAEKVAFGGGYPYAASGTLTDDFITITKLFKQVK
jgi:hypothetical protein